MRSTIKLFFLSFSIIIFCFTGIESFCHTPEDGPPVSSKGLIRFTENKGQWNDVITYRADVTGGTVFLEKKGFTYTFVNGDDIREIHPQKKATPPGGFVIRMHAVKVHFENALEPTAVNGSDEEEGYSNYFLGNDPSHWASNVKTYERVSYQRIYPGVDMRVYSNYSALKYDFIVAAGAKTDQISLKYEGADALYLTEEGHLSVHTSVGNFTEQKPYAYQVIAGQQITVECHYALHQNVLSFEFPKGYDRNRELIIDPTLVFSTLTGSTADNWGNTATYDDLGNFYSGGVSLASGYPVSPGAYQTTWAGGGAGGNPYPFDIAIIKYNPTGTARMYATYLGGSNNEQPTSLVVNKNGELYILGRTYSTNFPVTAGAFDPSSNGGCDIFIAKLNAAGSALLGSTYVGGSGDDGVNISAAFATINTLKYNYCDDLRSDIFIDGNDDVYVADCSRSSNFPVRNAIQPNLSGAQDGVVFKMNGLLTSMYWATYLGGSNLDAAYSIVLDNAANVVVCGGTNSTNFPTTAGAYHPTNSGGVDGYIAKIANNGSSILAATYIGTGSYDQSWLVQADVNNNIYVAGTTEGAYPVTPGVYSNANSAQFIHKLNPALTASVYSTVYGSGVRTGNISHTAFLVDDCENLYVAGWGRKGFDPYPSTSVIGMPITSNAYQSNPHDGNDFYFINIEKNAGSLLYATYFGGANSGEHVDGGTSRFDKKGTIYQSVCAACGGANDFPTTPGVWSRTNRSSNCNNGSIKMSFDFNLVKAVFTIPPINKGCAPFLVNFTNSSILGVSYVWHFGDGDSSLSATPSHIYVNPGTYTVRLIGTNQNTCNVHDTAYSQVIVFPPAIPNAGPDKTICSGQTTSLTATGGGTYTWSPATGLNPANSANPAASPSLTTNYVVTVTDVNGCTALDSAMVFVNPSPPANAGPDQTICIGFTQALSASGGTGYVWNPNPTLSNVLIPNPVASPTSTTNYIVTVTDGSSCSASDSVTVFVVPPPVINISPPVSICLGKTTSLTASGGTSYLWSPATGLSDPTIFNPSASPTTATTYTVTVTDANGCINKGVTSVSLTTISVGVSPGVTQCIGSGTQLTATSTPGSVYSWTPPAGLDFPNVATPVASPTVTTSYTVDVTDTNGCKASKSVTVTIAPQAVIDAGPDREICVGESVQLSANGTGVNYSWSPSLFLNATNIRGPVSVPLTSITYFVQTSSGTTCSPVSDSVSIIVHQIPPITVSPDTTIMVGSSVSLTAAGGGITYQWTPSAWLSCTVCQNPSAAPLKTTTYLVTTTDAFGCLNRDTVTINVEDILTLYVPTAFTPYNYDTKNNIFYAYGVGIWQFEFYIFDRWGALVFQTNDPLVGWDGTYKDKSAVQDVYVWIAKATSITGKSISKTGAVTVVR